MSQSNTSPDRFQESTKRPDLSVIIVSWNVCELLVNCLTALLSRPVSGDLTLETIVVDNASTDGSAAAARSFPGVRVIDAGENLGYGKANNLGMSLATGRHLLILNPDTLPLPGSLRALVDFADKHPLAAIVAPRLLNRDGSLQHAAFHFPSLPMAALDLFPLPQVIPGRLRLRVLSSRLNGRYPREAAAVEPFQIDHPLGACMLLNRDACEELGGFDPAIQMYSEEVDLALRFRLEGWECWQVPRARVVHLGGQSTQQMPDRMFVELWRSRLYLYSKHYPPHARLTLRALLAAAQIRDALAALVALRTGRIEREQASQRWRRAGAVLRLAVRG